MVDGVRHHYTYIGDQLVEETYGNHCLHFAYDEQGRPYSMTYDGTEYYYVLNLQGDVVAITNTSGGIEAEYEYDAWGYIRSVEDVNGIGAVNPLRYRGYYYDEETGFYYLNSRYYDPEIGRFINADSQISGIGGTMTGCNMYSYCFNNPVNMGDSNGNWPKFIKQAWNGVKYITNKAVKIIAAPFKATKVSVGAGIGIGAKTSVNVKGIKVEAGASASIADSLVYNKGKIDITNTASAKVNASLGVWELSVGTGKEHSFFDEKCECNILHDPYVQQMNCAAGTEIEPVESTIGFSIGGYLLLGGEISLVLDLNELHNELINIFTEP